MSFLNQNSLERKHQLPVLSQRGRSSIEFLGSIQNYSAGQLRKAARSDFESDPDGQALIESAKIERPNESWPDRIGKAAEVARRSPIYRFERLLQRYVAEEVYIRGVPAMEERREQFEPLMAMPKGDCKGSLKLDESVPMPDYYDGTEWHLEPGGWDGYDLYGPFFTYVAGPYIFKHGGYAAVEHGDDIVQQRINVVEQLPKTHYDRVYDVGCGGFSTLAAVNKVFPEAELVGSDLSRVLLENGHLAAERLGVKVAFKQRDARETGEADNSFDAVTMYALMHEMPKEVALDTFREALRILKPGGDLLISDPPPFRAVDPFQAVILDWDTEHRAEPYFSSACSEDWVVELKAIGFVDVEEYALGDFGYPWVTRAVKPG